MQQPSSQSPAAVPRWLIVLGSVVIAGHLFAVLVVALAAPSGLWWTPMGPDMASPPAFAQKVYEVTTPYYLKPLKMTHNYHFPSNRPGLPDISFEVRLKDEAGKTMATLTFPDQNANFWVRHSQALLARGLGDDQPVPPQMGEVVAAPGKSIPKLAVWELIGQSRDMTLEYKDQNLIPRNQMVNRPSDWSLVLVRSYARYLCRTHGAARAEILRHHKDAIPPGVLAMPNPPPDNAFDEVVSNFGEYQGE
jgi:hypothetical protein